MMAAWQPQPALLQQVVHIVSCSLAPDTALQKQAYDALQAHGGSPEFARYLAHVFARRDGSPLPPNARTMAGLALKGILDKRYGALPADVCEGVKGDLLQALVDGDAGVRAAGANAVATVVRRSHLTEWPALVPALVSLLDAGSGPAAEGALAALMHLSEDVGAQFDSAFLGHPLGALLPKLIAGMGHASEPFRRTCTVIVSNFVVVQPPALVLSLDAYMAALAALTADPSPGVRTAVARSLSALVDVFADRLWPHLPAIQAFELRCLRDGGGDGALALAAAEFWCSLLDRLEDERRAARLDADRDGAAAAVDARVASCFPDALRRELLGAVLSHMAHSDEDLAAMPPDDLTNVSCSDRAQDVRPHIHRTKDSGGAGGAGSGGGGGDGDGGASQRRDDRPAPRRPRPPLPTSPIRRSHARPVSSLPVSTPPPPPPLRPLLTPPAEDGYAAEDEDDDGSDPHAEVEQWTVRRACAQVLELMALVLGESLLPLLLPELQARLAAAPAAPGRGAESAAWRSRECGVFALGVVSSSLSDALMQYAPQLWPHLISLTADAFPLVRATALWCLSRYAGWLLELMLMEQGAEEQEDYSGGGDGGGGGGPAGEYADAFFGALAQRLLDGNRKVQEYAIVALGNVARDAGDVAGPFAAKLAPVIGGALGRVNTANRVLLFESLGALAEASGHELRTPAAAHALVPPIMARFAALRDTDAELQALLECLMYLFMAQGPLLGELVAPVFTRAVALLEHDMLLVLASRAEEGGGALAAPAGAPALAAVLGDDGGHHVVTGGGASASFASAGLDDLPLMMCALDLLGGMLEGLPAAVAPLVVAAGPRFHELLAEAVKQRPAVVRASAFALLGELARHAAPCLAPHAAEYVRWAAVSMRDTTLNIRACNNAIWAVGEMAVTLGPAVAPAVPALLAKLGPIVCHSGAAASRPVLENAAVALGRLALVSPDAVGAQLASFVHGWTQCLTYVGEPSEREQAYLGYCAAVGRNPPAALEQIAQMCVAFAVNDDASAELAAAERALVHGFRASAPAAWAKSVAQLSAQARAKVAAMFGPLG